MGQVRFSKTTTENFKERGFMNLDGLNIVVYDLEIKKCIGQDGIGWNDHDKMGISVGALYDYYDGDYKVYLDDGQGIQDLANRLNSADIVVAFNQLGFDNKLMAANGFPITSTQYDMLIESRKGIGWRSNKPFPKGCRLDDHLSATFGDGFMKTANGEMAPKWWQAKQYSKVITYCIADVRREKTLFEHIWNGKEVRTHANGIHRFRDPRECFEVSMPPKEPGAFL